jgi:UDP-glucose 4,6-dehydratase
MNNFFITGGAGFVGSDLCETIYFQFKKSKIFILDKLTYAGNKKFLKLIINSNRVKFIKDDINNIKKYSKILKKCDIAINVAAESHVDRSFKNSILFTKTNTLGSHNFFQECFKNNIKYVLHVSTDEVYGEKRKGLSREEDIMSPSNPYAASKAAAEIIFNSYKKYTKNKITIVRGNNLYGIRQYPEKLIPYCINRLLKKKKIEIHGNGKNVRSYLSVKDFNSAIILLIKKNIGGTFNIGSNERYTNIQIVKKICKFMGKNFNKNISFVTDRPFNDKRYAICDKKIKRIKWRTKKKLNLELKEIINWYILNYKIFK